ncbi:DUF3299 domain-containing protein [Halochromatium sp.]
MTRTQARRTLALILTLLTLSACGPQDSQILVDESDLGEVTELDWDALIPEEWRPEQLLEGLSGDEESLDQISDEDPRADAIMDEITALWKQAPVVDALDGQRVKLPGFVVPLAFDQYELSAFLLVPYFGACIHVPPPPANQIVYVVLPEGKSYRGGVFDTVWVTGDLHIERFSSAMGDAGYRLDALAIAPYQ